MAHVNFTTKTQEIQILNNASKEITAVFLVRKDKACLAYYTMDGELIKCGWLESPDAMLNVRKKLLAKDYKLVYAVRNEMA